MQLITNSVDSSNVREITENGTRYFVAEDVPFIRSRRLAGGYVPEKHVAASVEKWDGSPLTLNHPRNDNGEVVSANTSAGEGVTVGTALNPRPCDDDAEVGVKGDLRINADRAAELGEDGQQIVNSLESGSGLEVSSQYFADDLPAGEYDGERRARAEGNLRPDSIALLPTKEGVCSLPDCGISPDTGAGRATANSGQIRDSHLSLTAEPQPADTWDGSGEPSPGLIRRGLATLGSAFTPDEPGRTADPTFNTDGEGCGCGCGGTCDGDDEHSDGDEPADTGSDQSGDGNESPTPNDTDTQMVDISRDTIIESTAEKTGLNADALGELDDDALTTLYEQGDSADADAGAQPGDGDADPAGGDGGEATANAQLPDAVASGEMTLDEYIDERLSANAEKSEREQLADDIVANSAEYDADQRDELVDSSTAVLRDLRDRVTGSDSPGLPGTTGTPSANASIGGDDVDIDEFGAGVIGDD